MSSSIEPLVIYFWGVVSIVLAMVILSYLIAQRHLDKVVGVARRSSSCSWFYCFALFFILFDLETVVVLVWAVLLSHGNWLNYLQIISVLGILTATFITVAFPGNVRTVTRHEKRTQRLGNWI